MLAGHREALLDDVLASVSNGPGGLTGSSAEAKVRLLEQRLTGPPTQGTGRPPLSPRNLRGSFNVAQVGIRETTTDSSQPVQPRRLSLTSDEGDASRGTANGSFGIVVGPAAQPMPPAAAAAAAAAPPAAPPRTRKRKSSEGMLPPASGRQSGRRSRTAPSPSPSLSAQPDPSGATGHNGDGGSISSREKQHQSRTPPSAKKQTQRNTINTYFGPRSGGIDNSPAVASGRDCAGASDSEQTEAGRTAVGDGADSRQAVPVTPPKQDGCSDDGVDTSLAQRLAAAEAQVRELQARLAADGAAAHQTATAQRKEVETLQTAISAAQSEASTAQQHLQRVTDELQATKTQAEKRTKRGQVLITQLYNKRADAERNASRLQVSMDSCRLGSMGVHRNGLSWQQTWQEGQAERDIQAKIRNIKARKDDIQAASKAVRKQLPPPEHPLHPGAAAAAARQPHIPPADWVAQDEVYKVNMAALGREEKELDRQLALLQDEKVKHHKETQRLADEDMARFKPHDLLNKRYLLGQLLGKGGFSDVYMAMDLVEWREVAVKVHQLNSSWNADRKANYVRHAVREYNIQKGLSHPRIVALLDIFEIDANSFATVLEVATGGDLAWRLQRERKLPERDARVIASQIAAGLAYINGPRHRIIHYDLKPANILFDHYGEVKITDFGLSKQAVDAGSQGIELTSQGAGTYWYLPPECFETGPNNAPPLISNKVDVWSLGVILYQMLYGQRPFGEGKSQEHILREGVMLNAKKVTFPEPRAAGVPKVSQEAQDFITQCLAYRQEDRPDVEALASHPYMTLKRQQPATRAATKTSAASTAPDAGPSGR